ncbi:MAG: diguanylate cyclase [bacterium]|nr:diguanylate cyclase [bacterium]
MDSPASPKKLLLITDRAVDSSGAADGNSAAEIPELIACLRAMQDITVLPVEYATTTGEPLVFYSNHTERDLDPREIGMILIDLLEDQAAEEALRLLGRILQSDAFANTPVLVIGEASNMETVDDVFEAGAADFVSRGPALTLELPPRIRVALRRSAEWYRLKRKTGELQRMTEDLKTANIIFRSISIHDELTGVANRRFFDRYLDTVWRQSMRAAQSVSLIMIDIDYFKIYNDTYGHQAGDECLREVAQAMEKALSEHGCILARYGGEEFGAILPALDSEQARQCATRLQQVVYDLNVQHEGSPEYKRVTISQGIATAIPGLLMRPSKLIAKADRALYQAKAAGRNQAVA